MKISRAIAIILELAEQNILSNEEAEANDLVFVKEDQDQALEIVRNLLGTIPDQDREA